MRRIAAHFIWYKEVLPLHYVELSDEGTLIGVYPLTEEIAGTSFVDGTILLLPADTDYDMPQTINDWGTITKILSLGDPCRVYHLTALSPTKAKLGVFETSARFEKL